MQDIKDWLNGNQDWTTGCDLVFKYTQDKTLHRVFMEAPTPYKITRLTRILTDLVENGTQKATGAQISTITENAAQPTQKPVPQIPPAKWGDGNDVVLNALVRQWKPLFLEMNDLMSRLHDVAKAGETDPAQKAEAGRMAHRILDLDDQCDAIYLKRDTYINTGALPVETPKPNDLVTDPKKMPQALVNAKKYVRDYRAKLKAEPKNENHAAQLKKWMDRVAYYENQLK